MYGDKTRLLRIEETFDLKYVQMDYIQNIGKKRDFTHLFKGNCNLLVARKIDRGKGQFQTVGVIGHLLRKSKHYLCLNYTLLCQEPEVK